MPRSDRYHPLAKNSRSKWMPYDVQFEVSTLHLHDPTIVAGVSVSTSAGHDIDVEDRIVRQLVDRIPVPDHPGCRALHDLATGAIHASLESYRMQIAIFNILLSGNQGASSSNGGGVDSFGRHLGYIDMVLMSEIDGIAPKAPVRMATMIMTLKPLNRTSWLHIRVAGDMSTRMVQPCWNTQYTRNVDVAQTTVRVSSKRRHYIGRDIQEKRMNDTSTPPAGLISATAHPKGEAECGQKRTNPNLDRVDFATTACCRMQHQNDAVESPNRRATS
ncbi:hypothetical protein BKA83DRAFT_4122518 [Pisolithus microcarpus]|nr:hypothetical protein BKA83DRAFT_4122518 [Pisolithus microcarpus]